MYDTVDIDLRIKNLAKTPELPEYTNVELVTEKDTSVKARKSGNMLPPVKNWMKTIGPNDVLQLTESSSGVSCIFYSNESTHHGKAILSSPSYIKYADIVGRTLHFRAKVGTTGSNSYVLIGTYLRATSDATDYSGVYFSEFGRYSGGMQEVSADIVIGSDSFKSDYADAYFALRIIYNCDSAATFTIEELKLYVDDDDDPATVFTANCPWASSEIARQVLSTLKGFHYRPFEARGALVTPAAEFGDNVRIISEAYGLYSQTTSYGSGFVSTISAPYDEEVDHEFPYVPSVERRYTRELQTLRAELSVQADAIEAKVSNTGGSRASFGWTLQSDNFTLFASGREVFKVTKSGASISGHIVATSGEIGGCVIQNGILRIDGANINNINANQITAGTLQVDRIRDLSIQSSKLAGGSVIESKIGGGAVTGNKIASGAVSYAKTGSGVSGRLLQVDTNASNIQGIAGRLNATWFTCNALDTHQIRLSPYAGQRYVLAVVDKKPANAKYVVAVKA